MDSLLVARLNAVPIAFLTSDYLTSAFHNSLPLLYNQPPSISTTIFARVYYRGAAFVIPTTLISSAALTYLAYSIPARRTIYGAAAGAVFSILPITKVSMFPGINRLIAISKQSGVEQEKAGQSGEVLRLLQAWNVQNSVRAALTFAGGVAGLWADMA